MAWLTCPHCGFTQIPSARCLKCHKTLERAAGGADGAPSRATGESYRQLLRSLPRPFVWTLAGLAAAIIVAVLVFSRGGAISSAADVPAPVATPEPWTMDLTGRWQGRAETTIASDPPRPALREVFIETDRSGTIVAAGAVLTDPGHGGAGAGYLTVPDGGRRVREIGQALAAAPRGAAVALDFIPLAPWVPKRDRLWRAVEGQRARAEDTSYLLLESVEPEYLIQAGVNASGFLSYVFLSPEYAGRRGEDALSYVIHPSPDSSLRGFRNLLWDLTGSANFVSLQVPVTLSQPAGAADRIVLKREESGRPGGAAAGPASAAAHP
ncbi:MAG TPA: hypothetical protein VMN82_10385 [Thermoanaerobaculia bacterium]|nr:hypothetical protein [Thermoanaerobaculia bacterium]